MNSYERRDDVRRSHPVHEQPCQSAQQRRAETIQFIFSCAGRAFSWSSERRGYPSSFILRASLPSFFHLIPHPHPHPKTIQALGKEESILSLHHIPPFWVTKEGDICRRQTDLAMAVSLSPSRPARRDAHLGSGDREFFSLPGTRQ